MVDISLYLHSTQRLATRTFPLSFSIILFHRQGAKDEGVQSLNYMFETIKNRISVTVEDFTITMYAEPLPESVGDSKPSAQSHVAQSSESSSTSPAYDFPVQALVLKFRRAKYTDETQLTMPVGVRLECMRGSRKMKTENNGKRVSFG